MARQHKSEHRAPDTATLRQVATDAGRSRPSAIVRPDRQTVMVNIKMAEESAIALAQQAKVQGIIQLVSRALEAAGVLTDPLDLEDRTSRRSAA
jgi:hypothetical protein